MFELNPVNPPFIMLLCVVLPVFFHGSPAYYYINIYLIYIYHSYHSYHSGVAGLRRWLSASVTAPVGCIPNAQMSLSHADSVTIELGCPLDPQIPKNVWRVSSFDVWNV
jgi:hypothetical protein